MAKEKKEKHADAPPAVGEEGGRVSPEATGVDPGVALLGPAEIQAIFAKAAERDDLATRLQRALADLENMRRREGAERRRAAEDEADRALGPVLDTLDSFTRAVVAVEKARDFQALLDGLNIAFRELERRLAENGVTRIEGVGQAFDPAAQQAVFQEASAEHPPLTVLQVFAHGWRRGGRVIRPAQVKVSAPPPPPPPQEV